MIMPILKFVEQNSVSGIKFQTVSTKFASWSRKGGLQPQKWPGGLQPPIQDSVEDLQVLSSSIEVIVKHVKWIVHCVAYTCNNTSPFQFPW